MFPTFSPARAGRQWRWLLLALPLFSACSSGDTRAPEADPAPAPELTTLVAAPADSVQQAPPPDSAALLAADSLNRPRQKALTGNFTGEIRGKVYGKSFSLPLTVTLRDPLPGEKNARYLHLYTRNRSEIGSLFLMSADMGVSPVTRKKETEQFMTVRLTDSRLNGLLTSEQEEGSPLVNGFIAPNVSARSAPQEVVKKFYQRTGVSERFGFLKNTSVTIEGRGDKLYGKVRGKGASTTAITEATGEVAYQAEFVVTRMAEKAKSAEEPLPGNP
ncbi:hypothetical protein V9K67_19600 [Paraflavisolibacter sp. H34]|uniref:hypothetical protein n=1 Tax=Huijunlia imazamoxiresistens TaxID=3127457 RepID=UPI0030163D9C